MFTFILGVMFFGDTLSTGEKASSYIKFISTMDELQKLIDENEKDDKYLIVNYGYHNASPCVQIFPAFLALSKNFAVSYSILLSSSCESI